MRLFTLLLCVNHINLPHMRFFVVVDVFIFFLCSDAFIPKDQSRISRGTKFSLIYLSLFLKVVHHIHGWMAGKLQTCFSKDTGCQNQSMLTMTCECLAFPCSYFSAICKRHLLISQQSNHLRSFPFSLITLQ